jgi:hypothetical protein
LRLQDEQRERDILLSVQVEVRLTHSILLPVTEEHGATELKHPISTPAGLFFTEISIVFALWDVRGRNTLWMFYGLAHLKGETYKARTLHVHDFAVSQSHCHSHGMSWGA